MTDGAGSQVVHSAVITYMTFPGELLQLFQSVVKMLIFQAFHLIFYCLMRQIPSGMSIERQTEGQG